MENRGERNVEWGPRKTEQVHQVVRTFKRVTQQTQMTRWIRLNEGQQEIGEESFTYRPPTRTLILCLWHSETQFRTILVWKPSDAHKRWPQGWCWDFPRLSLVRRGVINQPWSLLPRNAAYKTHKEGWVETEFTCTSQKHREHHEKSNWTACVTAHVRSGLRRPLLRAGARLLDRCKFPRTVRTDKILHKNRLSRLISLPSPDEKRTATQHTHGKTRAQTHRTNTLKHSHTQYAYTNKQPLTDDMPEVR